MFDLEKYDLNLGQGHVAIVMDVDFIKTHHDTKYQTHALRINQALTHIRTLNFSYLIWCEYQI